MISTSKVLCSATKEGNKKKKKKKKKSGKEG
jgi:hypothetical protein